MVSRHRLRDPKAPPSNSCQAPPIEEGSSPDAAPISPLVMAWMGQLRPKLLYLSSGVILTLYSQWLHSQGAVEPTTHILPWTKYVFVFFSSAALHASQRGASSSQGDTTVKLSVQGNLVLIASGILDVSSYALACMGFACCGTMISVTLTAASSQAFNAAVSTLLLRRQLSAGRKGALAIVTAGILLRTLDSASPESSAGEWTRDTWIGAACVVTSALGYSLLGALYEWMMRRHPKLTHFQYQKTTALIGVLSTTIYQLLYTVPHWKALVLDTVERSGLTGQQLLLSLAVFGVLFNFNSYFQALLFRQEDGALGVGIVTAVRGAVASTASGVLFCSAEVPWQCLTFWRGCSAAVVAAGGVAWTLAAPALVRKGADDKPKGKVS